MKNNIEKWITDIVTSVSIEQINDARNTTRYWVLRDLCSMVSIDRMQHILAEAAQADEKYTRLADLLKPNFEYEIRSDQVKALEDTVIKLRSEIHELQRKLKEYGK